MKTILIVDDEPAVGRLIKKIAESCGYQAWVVEDPQLFMDEVVAHEPDALVLDLSMPGTDGVELLRFLSATRSRARILIMSGFDPRVLETAAELGSALGLRIAGTIAKPVRAADLRASLVALQQEPVL